MFQLRDRELCDPVVYKNVRDHMSYLVKTPYKEEYRGVRFKLFHILKSHYRLYIAINDFMVIVEFRHDHICEYAMLRYGDMLTNGTIITEDNIMDCHHWLVIPRAYHNRVDGVTFADILPKMVKSARF